MNSKAILNGSGACPSFFRGCIATAKSGGPRGGYGEAGYHLALHVRGIVEGDVEPARLVELDQLLAAAVSAARSSEPNDGQHARALWSWFAAVLPRCAALVPARWPQRRAFVTGVLRAYEERGV